MRVAKLLENCQGTLPGDPGGLGITEGLMGVAEGDEVLFGKYSGTEIKVDGEEIKILRESDILAKFLK